MTLPALVPRDPEAAVRTRRALDLLGQLFNSLARDGQIPPSGQGLNGLVFFGSGPPAADLGYDSAVYFDITDPTNILFYYKS